MGRRVGRLGNGSKIGAAGVQGGADPAECPAITTH